MGVSIRFIAVIGSNNTPLYLKSFDSPSEDQGSQEKTADNKDADLRYHFLAHMSLDYVLTQLTVAENSKEYALLLVHDGIAVYGTLSNTEVKFIVGTDGNDNLRFDIRPTFKSIQRAYISYTCNPFHDILEETPISSPKFDLAIANVVNTWNKSTIAI